MTNIDTKQNIVTINNHVFSKKKVCSRNWNCRNMLVIYFQWLQKIVANQYARNVWTTGLEIGSEAAKSVFIKAGNLHWSTATLAQQDEAMFSILLLLITTSVLSARKGPMIALICFLSGCLLTGSN